MQEDLKLPDELRSLERALGALAPAEHGVDRDALLFAAGQANAAAAARRHGRLWQGACGGLLLACIGWAMFRPAQPGEPAVQPRTTPPQITAQAGYFLPEKLLAPQGDSATAEGSYFQQRRLLLTSGLPPLARRPGASDGGAFTPTLRRSEGLEALPEWQRWGALFGFGGKRS